MKYSFVIIAYNEESNIAACINSIQNQEKLGKSYEVIVVDDGSKDKTVGIVKRLMKKLKNINLISDGKNHGRGYSRHVGVKAAKGEYIAMVDADIILPAHWLATCLRNLKQNDVVGGIAVPDGDAAYIYRKFKLKPKVIMGSTTITGSNGLYKREVFLKVNFNKGLREGEDVEFNHRSFAYGFLSYCIPNLTVEHQENKSFIQSMQWLYQSGIGATRQLFHFREIRLPDLAFGIMALTTFIALIFFLNTNEYYMLIFPLVLLIISSFMHLRSKFYLPSQSIVDNMEALVTNSLLIFSYYIGRLIGPFKYFKNTYVNRH